MLMLHGKRPCFVFSPFIDGNLDAAWEAAKEGLLHRPQVKHALDYFYLYECFVPIQVCPLGLSFTRALV